MSSHFLCFLHKLVKTQVTPLAQNVQAEVCVCVCVHKQTLVFVHCLAPSMDQAYSVPFTHVCKQMNV